MIHFIGLAIVFEFVQIDHHHGADTDEFGRFAQFVQFIVIIAAVVEPRQNVEIALEFDAPLFDDVEVISVIVPMIFLPSSTTEIWIHASSSGIL